MKRRAAAAIASWTAAGAFGSLFVLILLLGLWDWLGTPPSRAWWSIVVVTFLGALTGFVACVVARPWHVTLYEEHTPGDAGFGGGPWLGF